MRLAQWLWTGRSVPARLSRAALLPSAALFRAAASARVGAYRVGLFPRRALPVPTVSVGNLTVGGAGKTPLASWIAGHYAARGRRVGIVLRGYGADEGAVHRRLVPDAIVMEHPDRLLAGLGAVAAGADVIVLDDGFQRLDVQRDLDLVLVAAESESGAAWPLPAGPWREGWAALRRADFVVVTRRAVAQGGAEAVVRRIQAQAPRTPVALAQLRISSFRPLVSDQPVALYRVRGARVVAACGVAGPDNFAAQCRALGAEVELAAWPDHHPFGPRDVEWLLEATRRVDYVVVTEKDAVKLAPQWPGGAVQPLVAQLTVSWDRGRLEFERALDAALGARIIHSQLQGRRAAVDPRP